MERKSDSRIYLSILLLITGLYMLVRVTGWNVHPHRIQLVMIALLVLLFGRMWYQIRKDGISYNRIVIYLIIAGCIMRIGYMLYTDCVIRSHDLGGFGIDSAGHAGYILTIWRTKRLPQTNRAQFYQQPFFYILGAIVSNVVNGLLHSNNKKDIVDAAKIVSCIASCGTLFLTNKICNQARLKDKGKVVAIGLTAFLPAFYLIGGRVNCDSLVLFLMIAAIYGTICWYEKPNLFHTVVLALIYGCAILTKISAASVAIATVGVFVIKFVKERKEKHVVALIGNYILFGCISLPLGLWYSIRNYRKFGQSILYVVELDIHTTLYTGSHSIVERFLSINIKNILQTPYAHPFGDYNLPVYLVKSSLFGEFTYQVPKIIPILLLWSGLLIAILLCIAFLWQCRQCIRRKSEFVSAYLFATLFVFIISVIVFYSEYQFGCSMDFRYYGLMLILGAILLGKMMETVKNEVLVNVSYRMVALFGVLSCCMYCMCS